MHALDALKKIKQKVFIDSSGIPVTDDIEIYKSIRALVNNDDKYMYDICVLNLLSCEDICPQSSEIFLKFIERKSVYDPSFVKERPSKADLLHVFNISNKDNFLLFSCYDFVGSAGSIDIKKSISNEDKIEVYDSYRIESKSLIEIGNTSFDMPKVLVVDGYIENISNIHHILQQSSEKNIPLFIFARGFSNDVINTLSVNFHRKTLNVIPFEVRIDENSINNMFDIALVSNCEVISSEKGQYFSSIKYENIPHIDSAKYHKNESTILIKNEISRKSVSDQILKIKDRLQKCESIENINSNLKRIKNLTSKFIVLSLKNDMRYEQRSKKIKSNIRSLDHMMRYGYIKLDDTFYSKSSYDLAKKNYNNYIEKINNDSIIKI